MTEEQKLGYGLLISIMPTVIWLICYAIETFKDK